jgi:hypothetical protein
MDVLVLTTNPSSSSSWSAQQRLARWARVLDWHDYARELNAAGRLPWAWGLRQVVSSTTPSAVDHGIAAVYTVEDLRELSAVLDRDPLRECSDYLTVPLATLDEDFANDTERFENAKRAMVGDDPVSLLKFGEYEAVTAKAPSYVGQFEPMLPANEPVDFERTSQAGDPMQFLVNGVNPGSYIELWDDLRHLVHYQKVLWWHHYTWMLARQGVKTHTWGTHDFCTGIYLGNKSAAAVDIFTVPSVEEFDAAFALDPIRDDSMYQVAMLRPIADQRLSDERRAEAAMRRTGLRLAERTRRVALTV